MMLPVKLLLVHNPSAGHGRAGRASTELEQVCSDLELDVDLRLTERPGHATEIIKAEDLSSYDGVVATGGDGTVFESVNGLFKNPSGPVVPFGVLPLGTGNSFSRDLGLERGQVRQALELVARGKTRKVGVGRCRTGDKDLYYLNILGLGFVSDVTETASKLKLLGNLSYTLGVLYRTAFLATSRLELEIDGDTIERDAIFLEISNSRYTADFLMAPEAEIDDGLLDITLLGKISRSRLLRLFPTVFRGEHTQYPEVETFQAKNISVVSDQPKILSPDGELVGTTPMEVTCLHRALDVFC
jgi:YegS/Rv2252/BmrU family lipid kinase